MSYWLRSWLLTYYSLLIDKEYGDTFNIDRRSYIGKLKGIYELFEIHVEPHFSPLLFNLTKTRLNPKNCVGFKVIADLLWKISKTEVLHVLHHWSNRTRTLQQDIPPKLKLAMHDDVEQNFTSFVSGKIFVEHHFFPVHWPYPP